MHLPDKEQLSNKGPLEKVEFWFNYWNELYPIEGLQIDFEEDGYIKNFNALANVVEKKTVFSKTAFSSFNNKHGFSTTRHEHVHQLLNHYGYDVNHTLLFALVDNSLVYTFARIENPNKIVKTLSHTPKVHHKQVAGYFRPENSINHYDIHQDPSARRNVSTRMMLLLSKRLSRHCDDIEKLLATAEKYAKYVSGTAPTKRVYKNLRKQNDYLQAVNDSAFKGWTDSATENQQLIAKVEDGQEQIDYLNSLNMKWQGVCVLLAIIATALIVRAG